MSDLSESEAWRQVYALIGRVAGKAQLTAAQGDTLLEAQYIARRMLAQVKRGVHTNPPRRSNPPLVIWGNPGKTVPVQFDQEISERAYALSYRHVDDDEDYEHKFSSGVTVYTVLLGDRATTRHQARGVLLYRADGKNLWDDFEVTR